MTLHRRSYILRLKFRLFRHDRGISPFVGPLASGDVWCGCVRASTATSDSNEHGMDMRGEAQAAWRMDFTLMTVLCSE